jgi:hypothetical protein
VTQVSIAQIICQEDYVERKTRCNSEFVSVCVPKDYSCSRCWALLFEPCPGRTTGGLSWFSTFDQAQSSAERAARAKSNWSSGKCMWYDDTRYTIYIDDISFCNAVNGTKSFLKEDLKEKIKTFSIRFTKEINNYRLYLSGQPAKSGALFSEYTSMLNQAADNVRKLEQLINNFHTDNINIIEDLFKLVQEDSQRLSELDSRFKLESSEGKVYTQRYHYNDMARCSVWCPDAISKIKASKGSDTKIIKCECNEETTPNYAEVTYQIHVNAPSGRTAPF